MTMMMLMGKAGYLRERLLCRVPLSSTSPLISGVPSSTDIAGMAVRWREGLRLAANQRLVYIF